MNWGALLESVHDLQRIGMTVPIALEHIAESGAGEMQTLAHRWLTLRTRSGDPVLAMRGLTPQARDAHDRFVVETLVLCLERGCADHQTLTAAIEQLRLEPASMSRGSQRASRALKFALVLVALYGGDDVAQACGRTKAAFGRRSVDSLRRTLQRAQGGAVPVPQLLLSLIRQERSRRRFSLIVRPWAVGAAFALTVAGLGSFIGTSTELTLASW